MNTPESERTERAVFPDGFRLLFVSVCFGVALALVSYVAPRVAPPPRAVARLAAEAWISVTLVVSAWAASRTQARRLAWALPFASLLALFFACEVETRTPALLAVVTICVLMIGGLVGGYIGGLLEHPGLLLVVAYVAALGDAFSVLHPHGFTARVLQNPEALALLTLSFPVLGSTRVVPLTGIGDVAFAALFVVGTRVTGLSVRRTLAALSVALVGVVLAVECLHMALPAVPFLSAAMVLAHPRVRTLPAGQARRIALNLGAVTALFAALWLAAWLGG